MQETIWIKQLIEDCEEFEAFIDCINDYARNAQGVIDYGIIHEMKGRLMDLAEKETERTKKEEECELLLRRLVIRLVKVMEQIPLEKLSRSLAVRDEIMLSPKQLKEMKEDADPKIIESLIRILAEGNE